MDFSREASTPSNIKIAVGELVRTPIVYRPVQVHLADDSGTINLDLDKSWFLLRGLDIELVTEAMVRHEFKKNAWLFHSILCDDEWRDRGPYYGYIIRRERYEVHLRRRPGPKELEAELSS